jgi:hypothetical protein
MDCDNDLVSLLELLRPTCALAAGMQCGSPVAEKPSRHDETAPARGEARCLMTYWMTTIDVLPSGHIDSTNPSHCHTRHITPLGTSIP